MNNFNKNIIYLQQKDFNVNKTKSTDFLSFKNNLDIPIFILFQSTNCGYCIHMKPEYQNAVNIFVKKNKNLAYFTTIEINNPEDFDDNKKNMFSDLNGVPVLYFYDKNGRKISEYTDNERNTNSILKFFEKSIFRK